MAWSFFSVLRFDFCLALGCTINQLNLWCHYAWQESFHVDLYLFSIQYSNSLFRQFFTWELSAHLLFAIFVCCKISKAKSVTSSILIYSFVELWFCNTRPIWVSAKFSSWNWWIAYPLPNFAILTGGGTSSWTQLLEWSPEWQSFEVGLDTNKTCSGKKGHSSLGNSSHLSNDVLLSCM